MSQAAGLEWGGCAYAWLNDGEVMLRWVSGGVLKRHADQGPRAEAWGGGKKRSPVSG
jgi:hypothetical protein